MTFCGVLQSAQMPKALKKYVNINPKILGGTPVISGTRIPIERVYQLVLQGYTTQTLKKEYPWVDAKKIQYVIGYLMKAGLDEFEKAYKVPSSSR